ncbi:hypothetical protein [Erwinia phage COW86c]
MKNMTHLEAERKAWDEHTSVVDAITPVYHLVVWFSLSRDEQDCSWKYFEDTTFQKFVNAINHPESLLTHCELKASEETFCYFTVSSKRSVSDVMQGYQFLKGVADEFELKINYEKI